MKHMGVSKTNSRIVAVTAGAAFLVVFFAVASVSLYGTLTYQNRIIKAKKEATTQLKANLTARDSLVESYKSFTNSPTNIIGGSADGVGAKDGANAKLVLDALPGKYDFPAVTASLEKLAIEQQVTIESITGTDDEVAQTAQQSGTPAPVEIPFELKVSGDYLAVQRLVTAMERSIRPVQVQKLQVTGDQKAINLVVTAKTYYQPEKALNIGTKVIK
jgi:hypothetical protein